jgi:hypothetical protein
MRIWHERTRHSHGQSAGIFQLIDSRWLEVFAPDSVRGRGIGDL